MGATVKKNLREGQTVWQIKKVPQLRVSKRFHSALKIDVLIIGAGISGAMSADALSEAGLDVAIIDRRGPMQGSTCASTSLIQYEIDTPLTKLCKVIGKERAQRIWRRSRLAVSALRERARHLAIDADCQNRDSLYLDGDELSPRALYAEACARREIGLEVSFLEQKEVRKRFGIAGRSAILGYDNLSADPVKLAAGFLHAALQRGAKLYAPVEAENVEPMVHGVRVEMKDGSIIRARHVIFATGYEIAKGVPRKGHSIISTWALATRPQPQKIWPEKCFIWEASDPYLYMRAGPDGRIICGGGDEDFSDAEKRDALTPEKIARIEEKLSAMHPHIDPRADYSWTGNFGKSETGTPTIGPVPRMANCYAVMGYGGNGITFSAIAAQVLRGMLTGNGDADADLFSFSRKF